MSRTTLARLQPLPAEEAARDRYRRELRAHLTERAGGHEFLKPKEVAALLRVTDSSVYALMSRSQLPHAKVGGAYRIPVSWLADWLADGGSRDAGAAVAIMQRAAGGRSTRRWAQ